MILDVARTLGGLGIDIAFKLPEDLRHRLAEEVGEDSETAAVGHADDHLLDAGGGGLFEEFVEDDHGRFAAFEREPFLADEAGVEEVLEALSFDQAEQDAAAQFLVERPVIGGRLHPFLQPAFFLGMLDVHVFAAEAAAVGAAQGFENFPEGGD